MNNLTIQGGNKGITALSGIDSAEVAAAVADIQKYVANGVYPNAEKGIALLQTFRGAEFANAVRQALQEPKNADIGKLIADAASQFDINDKASWTDFSKNVYKQYGAAAATEFWNNYLSMVAATNSNALIQAAPQNTVMETTQDNVNANTVKDNAIKTDEEAAKSTNKMWAWIAGIGAAIGLYAMSKKSKGMNGLGCACDDKDDKKEPMAGVKSKSRKKAKSYKAKNKPFTLKM